MERTIKMWSNLTLYLGIVSIILFISTFFVPKYYNKLYVYMQIVQLTKKTKTALFQQFFICIKCVVYIKYTNNTNQNNKHITRHVKLVIGTKSKTKYTI